MSKKIIAITSCPVGVAHTYMAAENLERTGKEMGVEVKVETHGSIGVENKLTQQDINEAVGVIIAADTDIDKSRFQGMRIIEVPVADGINKSEQLIQNTLDEKGRVYGDKRNATSGGSDDSGSSSGSALNTVYRALMNGVSYMVPFVVTGGLLIAIALSLGGDPTAEGFVVTEGTIWAHLNNIGGAAMGFMNPILAGYIAFAIADRPGLVPGMVGGMIASNGYFYGSEANTGFIGAILAGFLAGYIALGIKKIKVPKALDSVMPIIFIPVLSSVAVGLIFIYLIGNPVAGFFTSLTAWLSSMQGASSAVLGAIIGSMIAVDMGGPLNKTAFLFGSGLIAEGEFAVMGAVAVAVSVPPLALGIASHLLKNKFSESDRQAGTAAAIMGFFGITEGAIPFAAKDPIRVIPSIIGGSAVGSIIAMLGGVGGHVAHGGPIVAILGAVDQVPLYFIALAAGVTVSILLLAFLKQDLPQEVAIAEDAAIIESGQVDNEIDDRSTIQTGTVNETPAASNKATATSTSEIDLDNVSLIDLMETEYIHMDLRSRTKDEVFEEIIESSPLDSVIQDKEAVLQALRNREGESSTGMGEGIAIPHAKSNQISEPAVLFGQSDLGIDWDSMDGEPAHNIFMILVPEKYQGNFHLKVLQMLSRKLVDEDFRQALNQAQTKEEVYEVLKTVK